MSLPRSLTRDFFSILADSISIATEQYLQQVHESKNPIMVLCLEQNLAEKDKYLIEVVDGSIPVQYKHTCLTTMPKVLEHEKNLVGKIISFTHYKIITTKYATFDLQLSCMYRTRYLVVIPQITIVPGDYTHFAKNLKGALVFHPGFAVAHAATGTNASNANLPQQNVEQPQQNAISNVKQQSKAHTVPYDSSKPIERVAEMTPMKISDLTIYTPKWLIKARVTSKSDIRKFNNQWGEGQLFSIDLCDAHGEIRAIFFGEAVNKWYSFIEEGQVYSISGGQLRPANKRFNNVSHTCEMTLDENSQIQLVNNINDIPSIICKFTLLKDIENLDVGTVVDILAIAVRAKDVQSVVQKASGNPIEKREVLVCDSSGHPTWVSCWGPKAQMLNGEQLESHPVLYLKGVRVNDWQGKKLDTQSTTKITIEPVIPEAITLRRWWNENNSTIKTATAAGRQNESQFGEIVTLQHIIIAGHQALEFKTLGDKGIVFTTRAIVAFIKDNQFSWPACPGCWKKMIRENETWSCQKCFNQANPNHSYILTVRLASGEFQLWATAMSNVAETMMGGVTANELVHLVESNGATSDGKTAVDIFEDARLSEFIFKIKITQDNYKDEPRVKFRIIKAVAIEKCLDTCLDAKLQSIKSAMETMGIRA
ncbi:bifunctional Nucleic acid-binding [Babesia duncani]|uniref:Replication protein A subunit n=1 Tax=Babesia duncani TaxID=323732 RepID=A0AAD9PI77_9APIC|nr:bifunctional Nucleic acid-binding [Babesia duncani]